MSNKFLTMLLLLSLITAMSYGDDDLRSRLYKTTNDYASRFLLDPTISAMGSSPDSRENRAIKDLTLAYMNPFASTQDMENALGNFRSTMQEGFAEGTSGSSESAGSSGRGSSAVRETAAGTGTRIDKFGIPWQLEEEDFRRFLDQNGITYRSRSGELHDSITLEKYVPILGSTAEVAFYFNALTGKKVMYRVFYDFATFRTRDDEKDYIKNTSRLMSYAFGAPETDGAGTREALEGLNDWYDSYASFSYYWEVAEYTLNLYRVSGAGLNRTVCLDIRRNVFNPY